jgi:predicted DNA-binding antitoxin AbrB/MazE fold protein
MATVIDATFDGEVFRPSRPVNLQPNTPVRITIEETTPRLGEPYSSLRFMKSLKLEGPPDWSANLDKYLYGNPGGEE